MSAHKWTQDIQRGDFQAAEEDLTNKAAAKIIPAIEQKYWAEQVNAAVDKIDQQAGPYTRYVKLEATQKVQQDMQQGRIQSAQQLVDSYSNHLNKGIQEFKSNIRPGHGREVIPLINGNTLQTYNPSDQSVTDYCNARRANLQVLKDADPNKPDVAKGAQDPFLLNPNPGQNTY